MLECHVLSYWHTSKSVSTLRMDYYPNMLKSLFSEVSGMCHLYTELLCVCN
jgi:hypothetical protein